MFIFIYVYIYIYICTCRDACLQASCKALKSTSNLFKLLHASKPWGRCYGQEGGWEEYDELEMLQIMGRAGRPQFDDQGVAVARLFNLLKWSLFGGLVRVAWSLFGGLLKVLWSLFGGM